MGFPECETKFLAISISQFFWVHVRWLSETIELLNYCKKKFDVVDWLQRVSKLTKFEIRQGLERFGHSFDLTILGETIDLLP